jgi:hypothetical protein
MSEAAHVRMSQQRTTGAKLGPRDVDGLGRAVLLLATELAVVADRQKVLEAVLAERGIDVAQAVRDFQPAGALAEELQADKARLAQLVIEALCPPAD